jgi:hypothetical protein
MKMKLNWADEMEKETMNERIEKGIVYFGDIINESSENTKIEHTDDVDPREKVRDAIKSDNRFVNVEIRWVEKHKNLYVVKNRKDYNNGFIIDYNDNNKLISPFFHFYFVEDHDDELIKTRIPELSLKPDRVFLLGDGINIRLYHNPKSGWVIGTCAKIDLTDKSMKESFQTLPSLFWEKITKYKNVSKNKILRSLNKNHTYIFQFKAACCNHMYPLKYKDEVIINHILTISRETNYIVDDTPKYFDKLESRPLEHIDDAKILSSNEMVGTLALLKNDEFRVFAVVRFHSIRFKNLKEVYNAKLSPDFNIIRAILKQKVSDLIIERPDLQRRSNDISVMIRQLIVDIYRVYTNNYKYYQNKQLKYDKRYDIVLNYLDEYYKDTGENVTMAVVDSIVMKLDASVLAYLLSVSSD